MMISVTGSRRIGGSALSQCSTIDIRSVSIGVGDCDSVKQVICVLYSSILQYANLWMPLVENSRADDYLPTVVCMLTCCSFQSALNRA